MDFILSFLAGFASIISLAAFGNKGLFLVIFYVGIAMWYHLEVFNYVEDHFVRRP